MKNLLIVNFLREKTIMKTLAGDGITLVAILVSCSDDNDKGD
ncbi:hypothetical protein NXX99_03620 [Bacteroides thetaiotaomicron]|nr:hypothetical protein [Bacteroides thetaiotaomicron]